MKFVSSVGSDDILSKHILCESKANVSTIAVAPQTATEAEHGDRREKGLKTAYKYIILDRGIQRYAATQAQNAGIALID